MNAPDANTFYLRQHEAESDDWSDQWDAAVDQREQMVFAKFSDMPVNDVRGLIADYAVADDEFCNCMQSIVTESGKPITEHSQMIITVAALRMAKLLLDSCDFVYGDRLVEECAEES